MKVLIVTNCFPHKYNTFSGIFVYNRLKLYKKHAIDVHVLRLNSGLRKSFKFRYMKNYHTQEVFPHDEKIHVTVQNYIHIPFIYPFYLKKKILNYVKRHQIDIVHFHFLWNTFSHRELAMSGIPYIITCHGTDINGLLTQSSANQCINIEKLNHANYVIFVSQFLRNNALKLGYAHTADRVIPNGIDPSLFFLPRSGIKPRFHIGFVGSLIPVKRVEILPHIFSCIKDKIPELTMTIVGDGFLDKSIKQAFSKNGYLQDVYFTGKLLPTELTYEMQKMRILLLPSLSEGWPCVVLEAQACGASVVGSTNGGIPEAVGEGGCLVEEGIDFVQRFADAIISLLHNPISERTLHDRAVTFSWDSIVKQEVSVYKQVLETSHE